MDALSTPKKNGRRNYMDAGKALAILLVIYGHTFRESMRAEFRWCDLSYVFVYRVHVSLLFILSGMAYALTKEKNKKLTSAQYLKKKAGSLLVPWISYSIFVYLVFAFAQLIPASRQILESSAYHFLTPIDYVIALLRNENPYSFHIWYLQTLFLFISLTFLFDRQVEDEHKQRLVNQGIFPEVSILSSRHNFARNVFGKKEKSSDGNGACEWSLSVLFAVSSAERVVCDALSGLTALLCGECGDCGIWSWNSCRVSENGKISWLSRRVWSPYADLLSVSSAILLCASRTFVVQQTASVCVAYGCHVHDGKPGDSDPDFKNIRAWKTGNCFKENRTSGIKRGETL